MSSEINFILNEELIKTDLPSGSILLDFIRNKAKLSGTKEGCREGDCGACAVLIGELSNDQVNYLTINSCLYPIGKVAGKHVVTVEGINDDHLTPVQEAYAHENASQCGFCTPGFIVSTTGYLLENKVINMTKATEAIAGNICRCTGYKSIERALRNLTDEITNTKKSDDHLAYLVERKIIPEYFISIPERLKEINDLIPKEFNLPIIVGGGTDLYIQKENELINRNPIFIKNSIENKIWKEENKIFISGNVSFEEFANSLVIQKIIPSIKGINKIIASLPIRNSATIAGNIVNASPIGDLTIILLAMNAVLVLEKDNQYREVPLKNFFLGYKELNKIDGEIIRVVKIDLTSEKHLFSFEKISKRTHLDIASVNSAININIKNDQIISCGLSYGGVAPIPLYMKETSLFLEGKEIDPETIKISLNIINEEISPITDVRGSAEYKRLLAKQLFKSHFMKLFPKKIAMENFK